MAEKTQKELSKNIFFPKEAKIFPFSWRKGSYLKLKAYSSKKELKNFVYWGFLKQFEESDLKNIEDNFLEIEYEEKKDDDHIKNINILKGHSTKNLSKSDFVPEEDIKEEKPKKENSIPKNIENNYGDIIKKSIEEIKNPILKKATQFYFDKVLNFYEKLPWDLTGIYSFSGGLMKKTFDLLYCSEILNSNIKGVNRDFLIAGSIFSNSWKVKWIICKSENENKTYTLSPEYLAYGEFYVASNIIEKIFSEIGEGKLEINSLKLKLITIIREMKDVEDTTESYPESILLKKTNIFLSNL